MTRLHFDGCPSWRMADERLRKLADEFGFELAYREVDTPEEAEALSFRGSPTTFRASALFSVYSRARVAAAKNGGTTVTESSLRAYGSVVAGRS